MDTRIKMPFPDYIAGIYGALSVAAALEYRDRTGEGQYIELAQVEGGAHLLTVAYMDYMNKRAQSTALGESQRVLCAAWRVSVHRVR